MVPSEPAQVDLARDAVFAVRQTVSARRALVFGRLVRTALAVSVLLCVGAAAFVAHRAQQIRVDARLWMVAREIEAEYDCCAGAQHPCSDAGAALGTLSRRLTARSVAWDTRLSQAVGGVLGIGDLDVGIGSDAPMVDAEWSRCETQAELRQMRAQLEQRAALRN